jgi:hypothetical protein
MAVRQGSSRNQAGNKTPTTRSGRQANNKQQVSEVHEARSRQQASKPNGTGRSRNIGRPDVSFWPTYLLSVAFLAADEEGKKDLNTSICSRCAALVIGSATAEKNHRQFHEQIDGIDQRVS